MPLLGRQSTITPVPSLRRARKYRFQTRLGAFARVPAHRDGDTVSRLSVC